MKTSGSLSVGICLPDWNLCSKHGHSWQSQTSLTPWSRVVPQKPTGPQSVKKFPTFCGSGRFMTTFRSARHLSLSWAGQIRSISLILLLEDQVLSEELKNQLDATYYFIVLLIGSTCFGYYCAHHQELATMMLITTLIYRSWFTVCWRLGAVRLEWCPSAWACNPDTIPA